LIAMGRIVELPSIKPRTTSPRRGLRKLSPDLIGKAREETAAQVTRVGLTFLGTTAFCLLSLFSPDSALLGGSERISVPFAGPVSFFGFMLLGPAVLIALRVYLQMYVEHSDRLDRLARSVSIVRAPTLVPLQNSWIRLFSGLIFYLLMPVTMILFAWKAAVFPAWGLGLSGVAVAVIVSHLTLPFSRFSWRTRGLLSVSAAILAGGVMLGFGPPHRPFNLFRANLSGQWLLGQDLRKADLRSANVRDATLGGANLSGAILGFTDLRGADLSGANLSAAALVFADLSGANLSAANLSAAALILANLSAANLSAANLRGADLSSANLSGANLSAATLILANLSAADLVSANLLGADLSGANLRDAKLFRATLVGANLSNANLSNADLSGANLSNANLSNAELRRAESLTQTQLDEACGNADTKLPEGLTIKRCSTD
jgi:uncharacterized protein YjbI with pentapeptide repeats